MRKWLRQVISGVLVLLTFAATLPSVIGGGEVLMPSFIYILFLAVIPFLVVVLSIGRSAAWERVGWAAQILILVATFLA